jgi:flagellar protein FlaI
MSAEAGSHHRIAVPVKRARPVTVTPTPVANETVSPDASQTLVTIIPAITDPMIKEVDFIQVQPPFSYARVTFDDRKKEFLYEIIEPQLNRRERDLLAEIKESLNRILGAEGGISKMADKRAYLRGSVESYVKSRAINLSSLSLERLSYYILRDFVGYGPVDVLVNDLGVEDISCDGVGVPIYIFHQKYESLRTNIVIEDEDVLNGFIVMLGQRCSKQVSVSSPILDGTTPEGHRIQATYSREVTTRGGTFTIRRFKEKPWTPVELIKAGTASPEMVAYLWLAAENGESLIICGGPAAGKTSTLNAIALFIPPTAKIVSLEDTREVNLPHENWIPGATRSGTGDRGPDGKAAGEVDMFDLVRAALRQRPNYIIVGEVRGKETYTMFQAMATGHTTYSTMHADSVKSMVNRLENPPINTPRILLSALRIVIIQAQVRAGDQSVRRVKQILEIVGFEPETNELITNTVYEWEPAGDKFAYKGHSFMLDTIMEFKNLTHEGIDAEFDRRVAVVKYMAQHNITDHRDIWKLITGYYRDPAAVMERIGYKAPEPEVTG